MRTFLLPTGLLCSALAAFAQSTVLYQTGFERSEGFDPQLSLATQNGWKGEGTGGNGLIADFFPGMGQHAFIGYTPPTDTNDFTNVWRPINVSPIPTGHKIIRFSVTMMIVPSTAGGDDDFRWSVYSAAGTRLLSIDFETRSQNISYISQDGQFHTTPFQFEFDRPFDLEIWMNFERNLWSGMLNREMLVNSQTLASSAGDLTLGDVDAVWFIRNRTGTGNNFMVFDDYRITAETGSAIPPTLEPIGLNGAGHFTFNVHGEKGGSVRVDVTTDLRNWLTLGAYQNPTGTFLFEDTTSATEQISFYRVQNIQ